jgi:rod shape-determining protein MreB
MLKKMFFNPVYVQISVDRMVLKHIGSGRVITMDGEPPFSHQRMLIGNFTRASALMKAGLKKVLSFALVRPVVLVHPLDTLDGGLSEIEQRVLRELVLGSGARKVVIWIGPPLSDQEVITQSATSGKK